jgi:hypothetical protein
MMRREPVTFTQAAGSLLDAASLILVAAGGNPGTAAASLVLDRIARARAESLVARHASLFARLVPRIAGEIPVRRGRRWVNVPLHDVAAGDRVRVQAGAIVPLDGLWNGERGVTRIYSGDRATRPLELLVERPASSSRIEQLRRHVRHALQARETFGPLTPDLERLLALPLTAAGLVLGLTKDAGRTGALLQADPQRAVAIVRPVAREAALLGLASEGILLTGLDAMDRLASTDVVALQDIGVITDGYWEISRVVRTRRGPDEATVVRWLGRLMGRGPREASGAGYPDSAVSDWRLHGALLREGPRVLHVGGAALLERTWGVRLREPDRSVLVRRLGIVEAGRCIATVHFTAKLRPAIGQRLAELRGLGIKRIAIFTEDAAAEPPPALRAIDPRVHFECDRAGQGAWLHEMAVAGARVTLVHTQMRDLLPPGGLSLCPVDAEAGSHGVLLHDPLASLVKGVAFSGILRRRMRNAFTSTVALEAATMLSAGLQVLPPIVTMLLRHGATFGLLEVSRELAAPVVASSVSTTKGG